MIVSLRLLLFIHKAMRFSNIYELTPVLPKVQDESASDTYPALNAQRNGKHFCRLFSQIQPEPAGFLSDSSVHSGIPFLKNARKILRHDANAGVGNSQKAIAKVNCDSSGRRILDRVREKPIQNKDQPFLIRSDRRIRTL